MSEKIGGGQESQDNNDWDRKNLDYARAMLQLGGVENVPLGETEKEKSLRENLEALMGTLGAIGHLQQLLIEDRQEVNSLKDVKELTEDQQKKMEMLKDHITIEEVRIAELEEKFKLLAIERNNLLN